MSIFDEIETRLASITKVASKTPQEFLKGMTHYDDINYKQLEEFTKTPQFKVYTQKFKELFNIDLVKYYKIKIKEWKQYPDIGDSSIEAIKKETQMRIEDFNEFLSQF